MKNKVVIPEVKFRLEIKFKHTENSQYTKSTFPVGAFGLVICVFVHTHTRNRHVWETEFLNSDQALLQTS